MSFGGNSMELNNVENFSDWDKWKKTLSKAVHMGEAMGMSEETIDKFGYRVGNFLSAAIDPENREQRVLQELWRVGDDHDRKNLSKLIVKMVKLDEK
jgi:hypothetical protein